MHSAPGYVAYSFCPATASRTINVGNPEKQENGGGGGGSRDEENQTPMGGTPAEPICYGFAGNIFLTR